MVGLASWFGFLNIHIDKNIGITPPVNVEDKNIIKISETLERFKWNEVAYDAYIRAKLLADADKINLENEFEKGLKEGIEKGKIDMAGNLVAAGFAIKEIVKAANLNEDEITKILN